MLTKESQEVQVRHRYETLSLMIHYEIILRGGFRL